MSSPQKAGNDKTNGGGSKASAGGAKKQPNTGEMNTITGGVAAVQNSPAEEAKSSTSSTIVLPPLHAAMNRALNNSMTSDDRKLFEHIALDRHACVFSLGNLVEKQ